VVANAPTMLDEEMAVALTRITGRIVTLYAIRSLRRRLRIKKESKTGRVLRIGAEKPPGGAAVGLHIAAEPATN